MIRRRRRRHEDVLAEIERLERELGIYPEPQPPLVRAASNLTQIKRGLPPAELRRRESGGPVVLDEAYFAARRPPPYHFGFGIPLSASVMHPHAASSFGYTGYPTVPR